MSELVSVSGQAAVAMVGTADIGTPPGFAHAIWPLCTPGVGYTTGAVLDVNGGAWTG